jgi:hypothetical protein
MEKKLLSSNKKVSTMKKTYMNPTTDVVALAMSQQMLAESAIRFDENGGGEVELIEENPEGGAL